MNIRRVFAITLLAVAALAGPVQAAAADEMSAQVRVVWSDRYASIIACNGAEEDVEQKYAIKYRCRYYGTQPGWAGGYYFAYWV